MKKKLLIFTFARSDYGILQNIIKKLNENINFDVTLVIGSNHLSKKFGNTFKEIYKNKIKFKKINLNYKFSSTNIILDNIASLISQLSNIFNKMSFHGAIILGDRYEMFGASIACKNYDIPIFHLCGGSITDGSLDNYYRFNISNMSTYHFVETLSHKKELIKHNIKKNIFISGSPSLEFNKKKIISKKIFEKKYNFSFNKNKIIIACFHPNTKISILENINDLKILLRFLNNTNDKVIFTYPNADKGFNEYIKEIKNQLIDKEKNLLVQSLGKFDYFSVLNFSDILIGNSSSGIIESASFKIPTINLGERQKGRFKVRNVYNSPFNEKKIFQIYNKIINYKSKKIFFSLKNPYYKKNSSNFIINQIIQFCK